VYAENGNGMSGSGFTYGITLQDGLRLISLTGRLMQREQAETLIGEFGMLLDNGENRLLLDLSELEYVNSSGLNLIIGMLTRARNAGGDLAICGVSAKVRELLIMTRLDSVFRIHGSVEEATAHLNSKSI
jgi:anti-sigma B factor antagonist